MRAVFLLLAALTVAACSTSAEPPTGASPTYRPAIRGVTLDAVEPPSPGTLSHLAGLGVNHIALIPFGFQERHDSPAIRFNPEAGWYSESETGARALCAVSSTWPAAMRLRTVRTVQPRR